ncbi:MAG: GDP-mannose 4,6-dehydratase [Deltaproteobacteria bacterium]|nr:GDP-mannose 4,6-dehydratase [Deltaproteobacteria bacterium]
MSGTARQNDLSPSKQAGHSARGGERRKGSPAPVLITGGAGFIGTNLAHRLLSAGRTVRIIDNLSRPGVGQNLKWLHDQHGDQVQAKIADVREPRKWREFLQGVSQVFHFAAQVAVTTSLTDPLQDFESNLRGTLAVLEALRALPDPPPLLFTSTNKVYGSLLDLPLRRNGTRYEPADRPLTESGIPETHPLDFQSPYGCSKGAADQYVIDYARIFGLKTVVFRMSCIYGPHQFGTEDQGWIAHFLIRALRGQPIIVYGDGMQVRDALFVDDLVDAFLMAQEKMGLLSGQAFNIGGGPGRTLSLVELLGLISRMHGRKPAVTGEKWRPGDQRYYVTDFGKFQAATGWSPRVGIEEGLSRLHAWLLSSGLFSPPVEAKGRG